MALFLEAVSVAGVVQRTPVDSARVRITAQQGFTYRLSDDQGASFDQNVSIRRDRNSLIVDGLPAEQVIELDGFFFNCVPASPCTFVTENLGGAANITPASEPVGALQDGTFMMFTKGQLAAAVPVAPEAEFIPKNVLVGLGAVALLGLAAGGGGGGKGGNGASANDTTPPDAPVLTSARLSKDARPILSGTAEAGSFVVVSLDIDGNGVSDVSYETQTDASGHWTIDLATATPSALALPAGGLPDGANVRVVMRARDQSNNTSVLATTEVLVIDRAPPLQTATISAVTDDQAAQTGTVATGGASNDLSPTLSGSISAPLASGDRIQVLRNGVVAGEATLNGTLWTFTDTVVPGTVLAANYTVRAVDTAGNSGAESTPYLVNLDTLAPGVPTIAIVAGDDRINFAEAGVPVLLRGTAEASVTVNVAWGLRNFSALADASGQWQLNVPATEIPGNGVQLVSAIAVDAAGNSSVSGIRTVSVETGLPSAPTINAVAVDNRINASEVGAPVTVSGQADSGNTVTLTWPGISGAARTAVAANGVWSITYSALEIGALAQGPASLSAAASDLAGNSRPGSALSVDKDTIAPAQIVSISSVTDNQAPVTGGVGSGGVTNDQTPTVIGTLDAALASGETLHVYRGGVDVGNATAAGTSWSFTDTLASAGTYAYTARVIDAAGNLGTNVSNVFGIVLDNVAPAAPTIAVIAGDDVVSSAEAAAGVTITGTAEAGATVTVLWNGVQQVGVATGGNYSVTFAAGQIPVSGAFTVTATAADLAGNVSTPGSRPVTVTGPPKTADVTSITDDLAPQIGALATGGASNDGTPTVAGNLSAALGAGETLHVFRNGVDLTVAGLAPAGTTWTYTDASGGLVSGTTYTYTARVFTGAVAGPAGTGFAMIFDNTAPILPTINIVAGDDIVSTAEAAAGVTISGTAEAGSNVVVTWGTSTPLNTVALAGGTFSIAFAAGQIPPSGVTSVNVVATDAAGNPSAAGTRTVTVSAASKTASVTGITDDIPPVTGTVANGATSNDAAPTITGTFSAALGAGETLHVFRNGVDVSAGGIAPAGLTWAYTDSTGGLVSGTIYTYTAQVFVGAVAGPVAGSYAMIFDNVAPALPIISVVAGNDIIDFGERSAGVAVSGTAESGALVAVTWGATTLSGSATGGTYTFNFSSAQMPAGDGPSTITAIATDAAGNVNSFASHAVTIATTSTFTGTSGADSFLLTPTVLANLGNPASVLNGGAGIDTFTFSGATPLNLNLTTIANNQVVSFERVDMTGGAANTLTLNTSDVLAMGGVNLFTGASWGGLVNTGQTQLVIDGDAGDILNASGGWASAGPVTNSGVTYLVFNQGAGASAVQLLVDTAITRNIT